MNYSRTKTTMHARVKLPHPCRQSAHLDIAVDSELGIFLRELGIKGEKTDFMSEPDMHTRVSSNGSSTKL